MLERRKASKTGLPASSMSTSGSSSSRDLPGNHAGRQYFKEMRSVEELMEQMSSSHQEGVEASQAATMNTMVCPEAGLTLPASAAPMRTAQDAGLLAEQSPPPSQEPFMPFDSQEALDKAIEEAKIAHIRPRLHWAESTMAEASQRIFHLASDQPPLRVDIDIDHSFFAIPKISNVRLAHASSSLSWMDNTSLFRRIQPQTQNRRAWSRIVQKPPQKSNR